MVTNLAPLSDAGRLTRGLLAFRGAVPTVVHANSLIRGGGSGHGPIGLFGDDWVLVPRSGAHDQGLPQLQPPDVLDLRAQPPHRFRVLVLLHL